VNQSTFVSTSGPTTANANASQTSSSAATRARAAAPGEREQNRDRASTTTLIRYGRVRAHQRRDRDGVAGPRGRAA
jgi:hypothetical protein